MPKAIDDRWNVFAPAMLPDVDGDGVADMVVANGGDHEFLNEVPTYTM